MLFAFSLRAVVWQELAQWMSATLGSIPLLTGTIGLASALVDNVPLVAATMAMFDTSSVRSTSV